MDRSDVNVVDIYIMFSVAQLQLRVTTDGVELYRHDKAEFE